MPIPEPAVKLRSICGTNLHYPESFIRQTREGQPHYIFVDIT